MPALDLVKLTALMERTGGIPEIRVGLIDGPVAIHHPDLTNDNIREVPGEVRGVCAQASSIACIHGTFVAGILCARRGSAAPAICPDCTLLVRPIFAEAAVGNGAMPSATPEELAAAINETIDAGARVINLSAALVQLSSKGERKLQGALDYAAQRGVILVAAAGNQGLVGGTCLTRHPWVIPVVACDMQGRPLNDSNLSHTIGQRGLRAPGENIISLGADGKPLTLSGTSVAAPLVTGALALLWSAFPMASAAECKLAVTQASARRRMIVPPVLDAWGAYQVLATKYGRR